MDTCFYKVLVVNILLLVLPAAISPVFSQDKGTLLLMNGKMMEVTQLNDSSYTFLKYVFDKNQFKRQRIDLRSARRRGEPYRLDFVSKKGMEVPVKLKDGQIDREDVFSFTPENGPEKLYYFYDEGRGNLATEEEMRAYVIGERDARFGVTGRAWFYSGIAVGFATGYASRTSVLALAVPPIFALGARIPVVKIKEKTIQDLKYKYNDDYAAGYESQARSKFTREALKGSVIGTVLGLITYVIVDNNF